MNQNRHRWTNGKPTDTFVKDKSDRNTCSVCGLKRKIIYEKSAFYRSHYVYYSFNIRETKILPECLDGNRNQIKLF